MIFTIRQLVEKSWEHTAKLFFTFVDLNIAYDSVPREAMWLAFPEEAGCPSGDCSADLLLSSEYEG